MAYLERICPGVQNIVIMSAVVALILILGLGFIPVSAQTYLPGQTYLGKDGFIEYHAGNLPIVISVPHGGRLEPASIPDRDCEGCVYVMDSYTQELARQIKDAFVKQTGCYPHVVYNLLNRKKLDMNRDVTSATDSNNVTASYWNEYHAYIDSAKSSILRGFGKGLFIDLHGHGHTKQRIEYGYLLYESQLRESDSVLNTTKRVNVSSIRNLVGTNISASTHAGLLRGPYALGTLFANQGFPGVPSTQDPFPEEADDYFNGGYNTLVHGSNPGGEIDAIQMELYSAIRFNASKRAAFADAFASVIRSFLQQHYFVGFEEYACNQTSVPPYRTGDFEISPNPAADHIVIDEQGRSSDTYTVRIVDLFGREVFYSGSATLPLVLNINTLQAGSYHVYLVGSANTLISKQMVVL